MIGLSLLEICIIPIVHFIADFVLQTDEQAINKSKNNVALTSHVIIYTACWYLPIALLLALQSFNIFGIILIPIWFLFITYIFHWSTDYLTSRLNAKLWAKGNMHNFFVGIGFDQTLHFIQLYATYFIIKNI